MGFSFKKAFKKVGRAVKKEAGKAARTVKKEVGKATRTAKKVVKKGDQVIGIMEQLPLKMSKEAEELARDAGKTFKKLGDKAEKAVTGGFKKQLQKLSNQMMKDNEKIIKAALEVGQRIKNSPQAMSEIRQLTSDLQQGKLKNQKERKARVAKLMKTTGLDKLKALV